MEKEIRSYKVEYKSTVKSGMPVMEGRAAVFNSLSGVMKTKNGVAFQEKIMPGAFRNVVGGDCMALFNHNPDKVLGRKEAGTLRMMESEGGLDFEVDPPDTSYARDLRVSMDRGDIDKCSFGFSVAEGGDAWARDERGMIVRSINTIAKMFDVSIVTYPAYDDTSVATRSIDSFIATEEEQRAAEEAAKIPPYDPTPILNLRMQLESSL
jgi:uncharacterized protein